MRSSNQHRKSNTAWKPSPSSSPPPVVPFATAPAEASCSKRSQDKASSAAPVEAFAARNDVESIVIAAPPEDVSILTHALADIAHDARIHFCAGGACRAESVAMRFNMCPHT